MKPLMYLTYDTFCTDKNETLGSISSYITKKDESDGLEEDIYPYDDETSSEDSDLESETCDEEYQCAVCKLDFLGVDRFEQHRIIAQYWR